MKPDGKRFVDLGMQGRCQQLGTETSGKIICLYIYIYIICVIKDILGMSKVLSYSVKQTKF